MTKYKLTEGGSSGKLIEHSGKCDICQTHNHDVIYDASIFMSYHRRMWAWVCQECFDVRDGHLGIGRGQKFKLYED